MTACAALPIWDCHTHIFGPQESFPMAEDRLYTPGIADADGLMAHLERQGLTHVVLVQPSVYGRDNSCLLDALARLEGRGRAIAAFDPDLTPEEIRALHRAGVRGVRVNLETSALREDPLRAAAAVRQAAQQVGAFGWQVQVYTAPTNLEAIAAEVPDLPAPLVIDHFGMLRAEAGREAPALRLLRELCATGRVYVKISLADRLAPEPAAMTPLAQSLVQAVPAQLLWGSDWPHARRGPLREAPAPFAQVDDAELLRLARSWCADAASQDLIFSHTPRRLFA